MSALFSVVGTSGDSYIDPIKEGRIVEAMLENYKPDLPRHHHCGSGIPAATGPWWLVKSRQECRSHALFHRFP